MGTFGRHCVSGITKEYHVSQTFRQQQIPTINRETMFPPILFPSVASIKHDQTLDADPQISTP
jgi:hypothetical protein